MQVAVDAGEGAGAGADRRHELEAGGRLADHQLEWRLLGEALRLWAEGRARRGQRRSASQHDKRRFGKL